MREGIRATAIPWRRRLHEGPCGGKCGWRICWFDWTSSFTFLFGGIRASFIDELRAGDNGLHQRGEAITICGERGSHALHDRVIGKLERTAQRVRKQFAAEVVDEILLTTLADIGLYGLEP